MSSEIERTPSPPPTDPQRSRPRKLGPDGRILGPDSVHDNNPAERYWIGKSVEENPASALYGPSVIRTRMDHRHDPSTPAPPGISHPILHAGHPNGAISQRRPRPETSHQKAVNMNRKMRIEHILHRQMVQEHVAVRREKRMKGSSFGFTAMKRIKDLPDSYDTENESSWGPGGLVTNLDEPEDFGEEALRQKKVIDRAVRRLLREEAGGALEGLVAGYRKRKRKEEMERYGNNQGDDSNRDHNNNRASQSQQGREREREPRSGQKRGSKNQQQQNHSQHRNQHSYNHRNHSHNSSNAPGSGRGRRDRSEGEARREEGLDDLDLDLLGESRASDHSENDYSGMDNDSEADDVTDEES